MKKSKRLKLEAKGWKIGTVQEFLDLSKRDLQIKPSIKTIEKDRS